MLKYRHRLVFKLSCWPSDLIHLFISNFFLDFFDLHPCRIYWSCIYGLLCESYFSCCLYFLSYIAIFPYCFSSIIKSKFFCLHVWAQTCSTGEVRVIPVFQILYSYMPAIKSRLFSPSVTCLYLLPLLLLNVHFQKEPLSFYHQIVEQVIHSVLAITCVYPLILFTAPALYLFSLNFFLILFFFCCIFLV